MVTVSLSHIGCRTYFITRGPIAPVISWYCIRIAKKRKVWFWSSLFLVLPCFWFSPVFHALRKFWFWISLFLLFPCISCTKKGLVLVFPVFGSSLFWFFPVFHALRKVWFWSSLFLSFPCISCTKTGLILFFPVFGFSLYYIELVRSGSGFPCFWFFPVFHALRKVWFCFSLFCLLYRKC